MLVISCKAELSACTLSDDEVSRRLRLSGEGGGRVGTTADKLPRFFRPTKATNALSCPTTSVDSRSMTKALSNLSWLGLATFTREVICSCKVSGSLKMSHLRMLLNLQEFESPRGEALSAADVSSKKLGDLGGS